MTKLSGNKISEQNYTFMHREYLSLVCLIRCSLTYLRDVITMEHVLGQLCTSFGNAENYNIFGGTQSYCQGCGNPTGPYANTISISLAQNWIGHLIPHTGRG